MPPPTRGRPPKRRCWRPRSPARSPARSRPKPERGSEAAAGDLRGRPLAAHCERIHEERMSHVSEPTVRRLSHYSRVLEEVAAEGKRMISSHLLAEREGITSAQVRKDLSSFGSFGRRGLGYHVEHLREEIRALLGLDRRWRVCVVGAGHIGSALLGYRGF